MRAIGQAVLIAMVLGLAAVCGAGEAVASRVTRTDEKLPDLNKTGVVVPWEDFKKILEEIRGVAPPVVVEPPPVDYALSACNVSATVTKDESQARVRLAFSIQVLNPERWVEVPVIGEGVALSKFEIDGRAANVYRKGGFHRVALKGEGRHDVVLEYHAAVSDNRGSRSTHLRFPQAPVISLDLSVPRSKLSFSIGGAVVRSTERSNGSTRVLAAFQQARDASVTWFKQAELDEKDTKLLGELRTLLTVGEGMLRGTTRVVTTVHGKGVDTFRIGVPEDVTVLEVHAQGLDDWKVASENSAEKSGEEAERRVLTVRLNHSAQGAYSFQFTFERALGDTTATTSIPDLELLDAIRDKGFVAVAAATNVEINPEGEIENATPLDPAELPQELTATAGQPVLYGFKYLRHPVSVRLKVVKHEDVAVKRTIVESARLYTYLSPEGKRITSVRYRVKNNRKQYLEAILPEGGEVWGAYLEDVPVKAARAEDGRILIPLRKTASNAAGELEPFEVELVYFERTPIGPWGSHELKGPELDVDAMEVQWHVFLPRDKRYQGFGGNLHPDDDLNRIIYVDKTAYNIESDEDLDALRTSGVGDDRIAQIASESGALFGAKDGKSVPGALVDVPAEAPNLAPAVREGERKQKRDQLKNELRSLRHRADGPARGAAGQELDEDGRRRFNEMNAPTQSHGNVAGGSAGIYRGGGRAVGVLPVRFGIPVDGLRLSFTGRILTAEEAPAVTLRYWPAVWVLSGTMVFVISFALSILILAAALSTRPAVAKVAVALPSVAVLAGLFALVPAHRGALALGVLIPVAVAAAFRYLNRARPAPAFTIAPVLAVLALLAVTAGPAATPAHAREAVATPSRIPDLAGTEVTLSWPDFKALVESTYVPPPVAPAPPTDAFLRSAEYTGRLEAGLLTLDGTLVLEVLKDGWTRVPLATQGTVIRFEGSGALLARNGSGLEVLARGPRTYRMKVAMAFAAGENPGANRLSIRLPQAPRNLLDLATAKQLTDVKVESGIAYAIRNDRIYVSLVNGTFTVAYSLPFRQIEEAAGEVVELEPRVQLAAYQILDLGDGVMGGVLVHDYSVRVAKVSHFDIDLPEGVTIFDCRVAGLESWKILQRDGQRYLRVKLLAPTDGTVRAVVSFEGTYDPEAGRVSVPRFAATGIEREWGFVAVAAEGAEVETNLTGNLIPADVSEMPADVRAYGGNLITVYKYSGEPDRASVSVTEHDDAQVLTAIIESLNATAALLEDGTEATWLDLSVRNNRKQFLKFTLPGDDVEVWSLLMNGQPAKPKRTEGAVLVPLPRGNDEVASRISLVLLRKGSRIGSFGRIEPALPNFDVPVSEALWTVYLPEGRKYVAVKGDFRPVSATDPLVPAGNGLASVGALAPRAMSEPEKKALKESYADAVSEDVAESQLRLEQSVGRQLAQKGASRRGALPVRIGIPGGVHQLPRVTVSRILITGDEVNSFAIRVYPAWITNALRVAQPSLLALAAFLFGVVFAGMGSRRLLVPAFVAGAAGLVPFGGVGPFQALVMLALLAAIVRLTVPLVRRFRVERSTQA